MKPIAILMLLIAFSAQADDQMDADCVAAVDAADSMNMNQKECDYSDEGLNGFLQKAFKKGEDGAVLETATQKDAAGTATAQPVQTLGAAKDTDRNFRLRVEVDQWANLSVARAQLLPKALEKCGAGFSIVGEHYRALAMGRIELALSFQCDK